ncbi:uncharacterized protein LOC122565741 isoform X2 [Bombus pyrosoma]|uniref:uncharacterized protein LOC122565741 isoform X2 n=1 Tax=Bombus pyrosoma TaxID=396416 RepID=UPI001CB92895|nr:uncharacterized protein LOC122565741 isoform X2 [Bombus pyrosoma]
MPLVIINLYSDIKSISSAMPTFQFNRRQFYYLKGHNRRSQRCFPVFVCVAGYCMWTTLRRYKHPLGTTIARPCISKAVTRIAKSENAFIIVHDATGKATTTSIPTSSIDTPPTLSCSSSGHVLPHEDQLRSFRKNAQEIRSKRVCNNKLFVYAVLSLTTIIFRRGCSKAEFDDTMINRVKRNAE